MDVRRFLVPLLLATTATHAGAQQRPSLRTIWTMATQPSDGAESQASMDPRGSQFNVRTVWTCRYTAPTSVTTPAGPRTFHRIGRELECDDNIGRVMVSTGCNLDAPDTRTVALTLAHSGDRAHQTTLVIECRTEPAP